MGRFLLAKATLDGEERFSVIAESALPHLPAWTAVNPADVRENPWDFEQPDDAAVPDVGPAETSALPTGAPAPVADPDEAPARNASAAEWRTYADALHLPNPDTYTRDDLRDHYLHAKPLPSKES